MKQSLAREGSLSLSPLPYPNMDKANLRFNLIGDLWN